jgi:hypothetical protein
VTAEERVAAVRDRLQALGIGSGFQRVVDATGALERAGEGPPDPALGRAAYLGLIDSAKQLLSREVQRLDEQIAQTPDEKLDTVRGVFLEELTALDELAAFLNGGDEKLLSSAETHFAHAVSTARTLKR